MQSFEKLKWDKVNWSISKYSLLSNNNERVTGKSFNESICSQIVRCSAKNYSKVMHKDVLLSTSLGERGGAGSSTLSYSMLLRLTLRLYFQSIR